EVVPVLRELGTEQEQAAAVLGGSPFYVFRRVTLPAIRWGVAYGVVLTMARAIGEFGAVSVVAGPNRSLTLYVKDQFDNFDFTGAYAASVLLAAVALATVVAMSLFKPKEAR